MINQKDQRLQDLIRRKSREVRYLMKLIFNFDFCKGVLGFWGFGVLGLGVGFQSIAPRFRGLGFRALGALG